ncbi:MAG: inositol monophosphatase family protein [Candidatus Bathyarchaeia archaeon]
MASFNHEESWSRILLEAAESVRSRIRGALLRRPNLETAELKRLLDSEAQSAVEETLGQLGVSAHIISEEGESTVGGGGVYVVIDPVDGTTNLARGVPLAVTSLAVSRSQRLSDAVAGLVMDLHTGDIYRAERNTGAWRGGMPIHPAGPKTVAEALISMDISKGAPLDPVEGLIAEARHLRQLGCSALSLCLLASGVLDAHVDLRGALRATDVAAGLIILTEAGGIYTINGEVGGDLELSRESRLDLVAASGRPLLEDLLGLIDGRRV